MNLDLTRINDSNLIIFGLENSRATGAWEMGFSIRDFKGEDLFDRKVAAKLQVQAEKRPERDGCLNLDRNTSLNPGW